MKKIDAHLHFSNIKSFKDCAGEVSLLDYSAGGCAKEAAENETAAVICMGLTETSSGAFPDNAAATPMLADLSGGLDCLPDEMFVCPGINPHTLDDNALAALDRLAAHKKVVGFKLYAGYYYFDVCDAVYEPVYKLAAKHGLTVAIHSGDTYSERGLLEYSHPLRTDRLAVTHRDVNFVVCHMGAPWIFDACEIAYKNPNVWLDMSGLLVGSAAQIAGIAQNKLYNERYIQAIEFMNNYEKLLYGTDWPLAPMLAYSGFIEGLLPPSEYGKVFYSNALAAYRKLKA